MVNSTRHDNRGTLPNDTPYRSSLKIPFQRIKLRRDYPLRLRIRIRLRSRLWLWLWLGWLRLGWLSLGWLRLGRLGLGRLGLQLWRIFEITTKSTHFSDCSVGRFGVNEGFKVVLIRTLEMEFVESISTIKVLVFVSKHRVQIMLHQHVSAGTGPAK